MLMSPVLLRSEKGCAFYEQQETENYRPDLSPEGAPHQQTRYCLKLFNEREGKIGRGFQMGA
jgi:hypothetical protein